ncbi:MAG: hypothetical protein EXR72_22275 [Myxococcales bacterium]|nr:hypothetical protein [Myxococcales bacterium]
MHKVDKARTDRRLMTPELAAARVSWLQTYAAVKCGVESVLRLSGRIDLMPEVFYDLAVPSSTKVTKAPDTIAQGPA